MKFGIIGGSGVYKMDGISDIEYKTVDTPFGRPSDRFVVGVLEGREVVFLARHGQGHTLLPSEINYRANIWGMKSLGVSRLISISAVGSLKEEIKPGDIVLPDQFIDRSQGRASTFFGDGLVAHLQFGDPVCGELADSLKTAIEEVGVKVHKGGSYVCIEGPMFSTRAESEMYRSLGASVVGMTNLQEAKLAREAELCFASMALATDYDCWHQSEEEVTVEAVLKVISQNVGNSQAAIKAFLRSFSPKEPPCGDQTALKDSILTDPEFIPEETKRRLSLLVSKYID